MRMQQDVRGKPSGYLALACAAACDDGAPCRARTVTGEAFCAAHLRTGYGLFTAAVRRARERLRVSR